MVSELSIRLSPLAHKIVMLAKQHRVMPGQALPDDYVEALLDSAPEQGEAAFDEIYARNLLEDEDGWLVLTEEGFDYIMTDWRKKKSPSRQGR
ncbi:hypothetical protein FNZ18_20550 [Salmonella enterica subsp. salamae]|nr:hypothetical protein [Salmonella enterica subsp. salamae]